MRKRRWKRKRGDGKGRERRMKLEERRKKRVGERLTKGEEGEATVISFHCPPHCV